MRTNAPPIVN